MCQSVEVDLYLMHCTRELDRLCPPHPRVYPPDVRLYGLCHVPVSEGGGPVLDALHQGVDGEADLVLVEAVPTLLHHRRRDVNERALQPETQNTLSAEPILQHSSTSPSNVTLWNVQVHCLAYNFDKRRTTITNTWLHPLISNLQALIIASGPDPSAEACVKFLRAQVASP